MRTILYSLVLMLSVSLTGFAADIKTDSFLSKDKKIEIEFYSYESGKSGYFNVVNMHIYDAKIGVTITSNDGSVDKRTIRVKAGETGSGGSFIDAGKNNVGVKSVEIRYVEKE